MIETFSFICVGAFKIMKLTNIIFCCAVLFFLAVPAMAQESGTLEEVIVMATKREQTLAEVPIAVSVIDAQTLEQAQINDILDLQSLVPSLFQGTR